MLCGLWVVTVSRGGRTTDMLMWIKRLFLKYYIVTVVRKNGVIKVDESWDIGVVLPVWKNLDKFLCDKLLDKNECIHAKKRKVTRRKYEDFWSLDCDDEDYADEVFATPVDAEGLWETAVIDFVANLPEWRK